MHRGFFLQSVTYDARYASNVWLEPFLQIAAQRMYVRKLRASKLSIYFLVLWHADITPWRARNSLMPGEPRSWKLHSADDTGFEEMKEF
ncbi:hypothetical protein [uncultured Tateyamaria sp.]|uniref:hypothetical protein n=1 Tax=uncultured Tateyamaria sp. TaxID=455651 RepID=UPI00263493B1|nr:hypothetical protein [uncultured Tateyamaria sp.]